MNDKSQVEYMLNDIRTIIDNLVIKLTHRANEYETVDSRRDADRYIAAYLEQDTFNSYREYPIDVLVSAGITNVSDIMLYTSDKNKIPRNKRKDVLKAMRQSVLDEYVEANDYYRELIGLPPMNTNEDDFLYLTDDELYFYKIDENRPIHEFPKEIQIKLERSVIPRLIKENPDKTYLKYLGSKTVNLVRARQAKNYEIIFSDVILDNVFLRAFFDTYDFCREYFMSMIYNKAFKVRYELYDNFVGMHIMIMTIQRLIVDTVKMGIERDYYDLVSVQKLFNVYGIPFFDDLPLDYQRMIVKNVNRLLRLKSTDKVLYDVANTLFYERVHINKFYLVKERLYDDEGDPITAYKYVAINEEPTKIYFRGDDNKKYYFYINESGRLCSTEVGDHVNTIDEYYIKDILNNKYKIFVKNGKLNSEAIKDLRGEHTYNDDLILYDNRNYMYRLVIHKGIVNTETFPLPDEIDYSRIARNKITIKSSNKRNYVLAIKGTKLTTYETNDYSTYAAEYVYIKDEHTDDKYRLYMQDDRLYLESTTEVYYSYNPVFLYNEEGQRFKLYIDKDKLKTDNYAYNIIQVFDYEKMYDVYFQSTDILERNVISALETKYNRYHYDEVVSDDVYWWETEELKKELYEREYNFIDTKYIGINIMQNVTKMLYETTYFLNLLVDHKDNTTSLDERILNKDAMKIGTDYLYLNLDRISSIPVSIFDTVIILCALLSKKNGMKGNIIANSPSKILSVQGFNFELNFDLIRENILKYKRIFKNPEIVKYLDLLDIRTVEDIDILYTNFRNFAEFCEEVLATTKDINEYRAYRELYNVFTVRNETCEAFRKYDGTVAKTYLDYLYDKLPNIAIFIDELHKDKTGIYIEHVLGRLNELIPKLEYITSLNGTNNNIVNALVGLITFFKSYTVDLRNLNVLFMFDNKATNKIFMIDDPRLFNRLYPEEPAVVYSDSLRQTIYFDRHDNMIIFDKTRIGNRINPKHYVEYSERHFLANHLTYEDSMELDYKDTVHGSKDLYSKDDLVIKELDHYKGVIYHKFKQDVIDKIDQLRIALNKEDNLNLLYNDHMSFIEVIHTIDKMSLKEVSRLATCIYNKDKYETECKLQDFLISLEESDKMDLEYNDIIQIINQSNLDDKFITKIKNMIFDKYYQSEKFDLRHVYTYDSSIKKEDEFDFEYNDIIHFLNLDSHNENMKIKLVEYILRNLYPKEDFILKHTIDYIANYEEDDNLDIQYNDVVNLLDADFSSNGSITITDSVKIIHED